MPRASFSYQEKKVDCSFEKTKFMLAFLIAVLREGDLQAVDRMIRLTRELDRYHGFAQGQIPVPPEPPQPLAAPARPQLTNSRGQKGDAKFSASQRIEIARNRERISNTWPPSKM